MNMKLGSLVLALFLGLSSLHAEAAKRLGGGKSVGQQSNNVTQREAAKPAGAPTQNAAPAAAPAPAPAPAPVAAQPQRKPWGAISAKGNQKLPFASYSTLPMSSCPSAGGCKVELDADGGKDGYCYSFTAWRYPDAFARQFRNCLAEFTDREFAIIAGGGEGTRPLDLEDRVDAALRGRGVDRKSTRLNSSHT